MRTTARRRVRTCVTAGIMAAVAFACTSAPADDARTAPGSIRSVAGDQPFRAANRAYLLDIGFEPEQARCVSRKVTVDLAGLLSGSDGSSSPTDKVGFEQFATATRSCISADAELTTTSVPPG